MIFCSGAVDSFIYSPRVIPSQLPPYRLDLLICRQIISIYRQILSIYRQIISIDRQIISIRRQIISIYRQLISIRRQIIPIAARKILRMGTSAKT
jgi:hypothetical protein